MTFIIILAAIFFILSIVLFSTITVSARTVPFRHQGVKIVLRVRVLFVKEGRVFIIQKDNEQIYCLFYNDPKKGIRKIYDLKKFVTTYRKNKALEKYEKKAKRYLIKNIVKSVDIKKLDVQLRIGIADAFITAITNGVITILLNTFLLATELLREKRNVHIKMVPVFKKEHVSADISCIIGFHLANIIREYLKYYLVKRRWKYASNRKYYAGNHERIKRNDRC